MRRFLMAVCSFVFWAGVLSPVPVWPINIEHAFSGNIFLGSYPYGNLTLSEDGASFYGMTSHGGTYDAGVIFSIPVGGGEITILHEFAEGSADGGSPYGSLTLSKDGTTLFGMTSVGGTSGEGVIFAMPVAGGAIAIIHNFAGGGSDGSRPEGDLTLSGDGTTLYGMTYGGGDDDFGVIFSIGVAGNDFTLLHEFLGGASDGKQPEGSLTLSGDGTTLYGMTFRGGDDDLGVILSIGVAGNDYSLLHEFAGGDSDGSGPGGSLTISASGTTLFGMTSAGGDHDIGVIFSIPAVGGDLTLLHEFAGGDNDGSFPTFGRLTMSGDGATLFGMTYGGGDALQGVIFSVPTAGGPLTLLHEFAGGALDGSSPFGSLLLSESEDGATLYGMTGLGGDADIGVVFSISTAGGDITLLHEFSGAEDGSFPYGSLTLSGDGSTLYGMTSGGGYRDAGVIFSIPAAGGDITLLHEFAGGGGDGRSPMLGRLTLSGNGSTLYGMTLEGGDAEAGVIFSIPVSGGPTVLLHEFAGDDADGGRPYGSLTLSGNGSTLYGMTLEGGDYGRGVIFSIPAAGGAVTLMHEFAGEAVTAVPRGVA